MLTAMAGSSAYSAQWGQSGKGGDGGYSWTGNKPGFLGQPSVDGKGSDGGEGGTSANGHDLAGQGGAIGSTDPDQASAIKGGNGTAAQNPAAACIPDGGLSPDSCGKGAPGGGGGGAGLSPGQQSSESHGNSTGGNGGAGGSTIWNPGGGGEGGAGGAGLFLKNGDFTNNHILTGGHGGAGGIGGTTGAEDFDTSLCEPGATCYSGRGGDGGAGVDVRQGGYLTNNKTIVGGDGGAGGSGTGTNFKLGDGGDGGNGVDLSGGSRFINNGSVTGGKAGKSSASVPSGAVAGKDGSHGIGVYAKGDGNIVINEEGGLISAGGAKPGDGIAIQFDGKNNTYVRHNGSIIIGRVIASGSNNGLSLGGDQDQNFDLSEMGETYIGFERFQKDDSATATVSGVGTHIGETIINDGRLKLSQDGSLESSSNINNNAKVDITEIDEASTKIKSLSGARSEATVYLGDKELIITGAHGRYAGKLDGGSTSTFTLAGGHQVFTGDNSAYKGRTNINDGTELTIEQDLGGTIEIHEKGILSGTGSAHNLINRGVFVVGNGSGYTTKTIKGDYTGKSGTLVLNTELGGDASPTDRLVILGNSAGQSNVKVNNRSGLGAQTQKGIRIISVGGESNGQFDLIGDYQLDGQNVVEGGAYVYGLKKGDADGKGGDIYLTSQLKDGPVPCELDGTCPPISPSPTNYSASVPLVSAYVHALRGFNTTGSLQERIGNRYWKGLSAYLLAQGDGPGKAQTAPNPDEKLTLTDYGLFWSKVSGRHDRLEPDSSSIRYRSSIDSWSFTAGLDNQLYENQRGHFIGGVWFEYGRIDAHISSSSRDGKIKTSAYSVGTSLTWYDDSGLYMDGQSKLTWYKNDIDSDRVRGSVVDGAKALGYAVSVESGQRFSLNDYWSVTPQVQLSWSSLSLDDFKNVFDVTSSFERQSDLTARIGLLTNYANAWQDADGFTRRADFYAGVNLYQALVRDESNVRISVSGRPDAVSAIIDPGSVGKTAAGIIVGGTYAWHDNKYSLFGSLNTSSSTKNFGDSYTVSGNVGLSIKW